MIYKWLPVFAALFFVACGEDTPSGSSGSQEPKEPFKVVLENDSIKAILGSDHFKLVIRDDDEEIIRLFEYDAGKFSQKVLVDDMDVYHPTFSPDGKKVAFSSAYEGAPFSSSLYVVDVDNPEKIDTLDVESAAVPRWYVTPDGDTTIVYIDYTGDDTSEGWFSSATWRVTYAGGKFGKPEKVVDYSYNGGVAFDNSFVATGGSRLYFHRLEDDKDVVEERYGDQQVCNVSVSRDSTRLISFLETAGKVGRAFTHDDSGIWHHFVFYEDETGAIVKAIEAFGDKVFDHVEWLAGVPMQVGIISSSKVEQYYQVAVIDYSRSKVHLLLESDRISMWHPDLWIDR